MRLLLYILPFFILANNSVSCLYAQEAFYDPETRKYFDSLELRITNLSNDLRDISPNKDPNYYYKKRELDISLFLKYYNNYVYDEELDKADSLVKTRLAGATKRRDDFSINFYNDYKSKVTDEKMRQLVYYQKFISSERNFKKKFEAYIDEGSDYSIARASRMTNLAMKYAMEKDLKTVQEYLKKYYGYIEAINLKKNSPYDLIKLTQSESAFQKVFKPMIESDTLEIVRKAETLVELCYNHAANTNSSLDTKYFEKKRDEVKVAIKEAEERQRIMDYLAVKYEQGVTARLDSLNSEGIYKWNDKIIVVGHIKPDAKSSNVRKGEAIIDADQRLLSYIRVNKIARLDGDINMGNTYLIPFILKNESSDFHYDPNTHAYQYMVCYTLIENNMLTSQISKFLAPLKFNYEK